MHHRLTASLIVGIGLVCAMHSPVAAQAQDKGNEGKRADSSRGRDDSGEISESKIDKAIEVYESRAEEDLDQTRKDIDRLRKQLDELNELRLDMVMAVAQLRADLTAQAAVAQSTGGDSVDQDKGQSDSIAKERKRVRAIELTREYRQIQELLRNEVQQAKSSTEQFVSLLRSLRAQQHQREEQIKADRERRKQAEAKAKEDSNR